MFRTRGFIFRKRLRVQLWYGTSTCISISSRAGSRVYSNHIEDIKKLKIKILIEERCMSLVYIVQPYYSITYFCLFNSHHQAQVKKYI